MLTPKQNLLETLKKDGKPECLCNSYTMFRGIPGDPVFKLVRGNRVRGTNSYDQWGTYIMFPEDAPAAVPLVTEENQVVQDITEWKKYVKVPDLAAKCAEGWEDAIAAEKAIDHDKYLTMVVMGTGIFEQLHMLMTFEDTLMNFLLEPEAMHELIDVICEYRLTYMKLIVEHLHPDCIVSHDDWGAKNSMFMSPEVWREFFKEPYRRLYDYLHENGVIVMHHGDSFMEPIVEDMAEIGVDIWQGVLPSNDIKAISEKVGDRMLLMGGIDSVIDREDATEEEIRKETRRACDEYGHLKGFMPCMTYGGPGTIYPEVENIIIDEINKYNEERFGVAIA
ncbi:MAG: uroporphyrinogen decarboxylase family protein [Lachnospiraceae bacterium]|nr:uroporphyrinogen decarboxylase family protein [Lachnospiraceae bacterium]